MNIASRQVLEPHGPNSPTEPPLPTRDRVLEVACEMFAEAGFNGTHLRELCKRAGTNVAGVCYHFQSKEGLYEAVCMEAGRRLSDPDANLATLHALPPEERLQKLTESLLHRLNAGRVWIAKLLAREFVDPGSGTHNYAASGLARDFILLQAGMRDVLGPKASSEAIRLHALSVIGNCVFFCLAAEARHHPLTQLAVCLPSPAHLARLITQRSLTSLEREQKDPPGSH